MGLLDTLIGNVLGSALAAATKGKTRLARSWADLPAVTRHRAEICCFKLCYRCLQQNGGLEGVLGKLRQGGLGQQADSWVSTGQNMNISADQLQQIFGSSTMRDLASQLGMPQEQAGSTMAQVLPELINQLTPQGQVPANGDEEIAEGLSMLANPELLRRV